MIIITVLLGIIVVILFGFVIYFYIQNKTTNEKLTDLTHGPESWLMTPDSQLLHSTREKADQILTQAEVEAIKIATQTKLESADLQKKLKRSLNSLSAKCLKLLKEHSLQLVII